MTRYALLALPSANRVYRGSAPELAVAELGVLDAGVLGGRLRDIGGARIGGVPYLVFGSDGPLDDAALGVVAQLSTAYALFEAGHDGRLAPVELPPAADLDDDLVTVQKYAGKTNEQFTRLLLNVTAASSAGADRFARGGLTVLDPLCGRGTTLNTALLAATTPPGSTSTRRPSRRTGPSCARGWSASGSSTGRRTDRCGARAPCWGGGSRRRSPRRGRRTGRARCAVSRWSPPTPSTPPTSSGRPPSTSSSPTPPTGCSTASRTGVRQARNPLVLIEEALPVWVRLLRPGGAVGIAWNTLVAPRAELVRLLGAAGLEPLDDGPYRGFEHRVDQAIVRDVAVARLP